MPVTSNSTQITDAEKQVNFNPYDDESWFFGLMTRSDATELLSKNNDIGSFLVRESISSKGDLVLSVREGDDKISHYIINRHISDKGQPVFKIGEQNFSDIPSLLIHYGLNDLDVTPLKVPAVPKDPKIHKRSFTKDYLAEVQRETQTRNNQIDFHQKNLPSSLKRKLPSLAKVIQSKIPNAYDKTALTLKEGEIVRVTKVDISGCWEGEISGRKGHFPFNYVKFIEDPIENTRIS